MKKAITLFVCLIFMVVFAQEKPWVQVANTLPNRSDGAFVRLYPNKTFQLFGVGSASYESGADNDDKLRIEKQALLDAKAELIKFIKQDLSASNSAKNSFREARREASVNGSKESQTLMISEQDFLSQIKSSSSMFLQGIVTLKVVDIPKGKGGVIKALVGVSSVTQNVVASVQAELNPAQSSSVPAVASDAVAAPVKKVEEWIKCVGRGTDRNAAVQAALIEGIKQVYGVYLENEETMKKRFAEFKKQKSSFTEKSTIQKQRVLSLSKGFIREYRIVSVTAVGGLQEACVQAWIVNPRSNGVRTVVVYPMSISLSKGTNNYEIGPEWRLSGAEMAALCSRKLEEAFNQANKFVVLNKSDVRAVLAEQKATSELVLEGKALPLEMAKMGQILCADYIFIPEFDDIAYSRKISYDKASKKFLPKITLRFSFRYRLIEVRTGSQIKNEEISIALDNQEIQQLLEDDGRKNDILKMLFDKAVVILSKKVDF